MRDIRNYLLLFLSVSSVLLCFEVVFRVRAWRNDLGRLQGAGRVAPPRPGQPVRVGHMIQVSRNPRIIYDLIHNRSFDFMGQVVRVNADGFRGALIPPEKPSGTVRIVGLGDSVMFGWGVAEDKTYLSRLSQQLNFSYPDRAWEVINTAVPGYNTAMEVATLKVKGLQYEPDIVIVNFVDNDLSLPNFIRDASVFHSVKRSFLLDYFRGRLPSASLVEAPRASDGRGFERDPHYVPAEYRGMVGIKGYRRAMHELESLSTENGFDVVVLSHTLLPNFVKELSLSLGFYTAETQPAWLEYVRRNNLADPRSAWRVSSRDAHPSALGHEVMADALVACLIGNGIIEGVAKEIRGS